jgi:hypothetical protein
LHLESPQLSWKVAHAQAQHVQARVRKRIQAGEKSVRGGVWRLRQNRRSVGSVLTQELVMGPWGEKQQEQQQWLLPLLARVPSATRFPVLAPAGTTTNPVPS